MDHNTAHNNHDDGDGDGDDEVVEAACDDGDDEILAPPEPEL